MNSTAITSQKASPTLHALECEEEPFHLSFADMRVTTGLEKLKSYVVACNDKPAPFGYSFVVHRVSHCKPEEVVLRIPRRDDDPHTNQELIREVRFLTKLEHPGVIKPLAIFHTPRIGMVEVLPAYDSDLEEYCWNYRYDPRFLVSLSQQTLSALHYLHGKGLIHADVKQQNTLVKMTECGMKFVLCDFGLAGEHGSCATYDSSYHPPELSKPWHLYWGDNKDVCGKLFGHSFIFDGAYRPEVDIWMHGLMMFRTFCTFPIYRETMQKQLGTIWTKLQEQGPEGYAAQLVCEQKTYQDSVGRDQDSYCRTSGEEDMEKLRVVMVNTLKCLAIDREARPSTESLIESYRRL